MIKTNDVGLFGKLPAHGDFIYRDLPSHFINAWDAWLQGFIANSQQELGDDWLDIYLTSPIWRFVFTDGIFDRHYWAGIILPSVDRVGRYFPFSIATRITTTANPFSLIQQDNWFTRIEDLALSALDGQMLLDELSAEINKQKINVESAIQAPPQTKSAGVNGLVLPFHNGITKPDQAYTYLLDGLLRSSAPTYSIWTTANGSERVTPVLATTQGLPSLRHTTALLDGNWQDSGWSLITATSHTHDSSINIL